MEAKLKEYRALRRRKQLINEAKEKLEAGKNKIVDLLVPKVFTDMGKERDEEEVLLVSQKKFNLKLVINVVKCIVIFVQFKCMALSNLNLTHFKNPPLVLKTSF